MLLKHTHRFDFVSYYNSASKGFCDVKVFRAGDSKIVVATDPILPDGDYANDGLSLTNGIEFVATALSEQGWTWDQFIEYLPDRGFNRVRHFKDPLTKPTAALVTFNARNLLKIQGKLCTIYGRPNWKFASFASLEKLLGEPFPFWFDDERMMIDGEIQI